MLKINSLRVSRDCSNLGVDWGVGFVKADPRCCAGGAPLKCWGCQIRWSDMDGAFYLVRPFKSGYAL